MNPAQPVTTYRLMHQPPPCGALEKHRRLVDTRAFEPRRRCPSVPIEERTLRVGDARPSGECEPAPQIGEELADVECRITGTAAVEVEEGEALRAGPNVVELEVAVYERVLLAGKPAIRLPDVPEDRRHLGGGGRQQRTDVLACASDRGQLRIQIVRIGLRNEVGRARMEHAQGRAGSLQRRQVRPARRPLRTRVDRGALGGEPRQWAQRGDRGALAGQPVGDGSGPPVRAFAFAMELDEDDRRARTAAEGCVAEDVPLAGPVPDHGEPAGAAGSERERPRGEVWTGEADEAGEVKIEP